MRYTEFSEAAGVGKIVQGVNTTPDVGPNELHKQAAKFGFDLTGIVETDDEVLDVPTKSIKEIAKLHDVSKKQIRNQLAMGIKVETEHTTNYHVARKIALAHLEEHPDYYDRLKKVEQ